VSVIPSSTLNSPVTLSFLLALLFAGELLIPGHRLFRWDTIVYNYPLTIAARSQLLSGHIPFWTDQICCGTPLLANINAGLLYPLRVLCWLLPLSAGYHLFLFVHVWLSFLGMYVFLRRVFRISSLPAWLGSLAYGASGYARAMWDTHNFMALPWIPLAFAALFADGDARPSVRAVLLTSLSWTMLILCGDLQSALIWWPAALGLVLLSPWPRRRLIVLLSASITALLITAPQWIPSFFAGQLSYRQSWSPAEAGELSLHPIRLLELLLPFLFGTRDHWFGACLTTPHSVRTIPWLTSFHVGVIPLAFSVPALLQRRKAQGALWATVLAGLSLLLALGAFLPGFNLWQQLPVIRLFRYPQKYLLWTTFALSSLAAYGAQSLLDFPSRYRRPLLITLLVLTAAVIPAARLAALLIPDHVDWIAVRSLTSLLILGSAVILLLRKTRSSLLLPLLLALTLAGLIWNWYREIPTTTNVQPLRLPAAARIVRTTHPQGRWLRDPALLSFPSPTDEQARRPTERQAQFDRETMLYNAPILWGLRSADGFSPVESARMRAFRLHTAVPPDGSVPPISPLADFIRRASVEWLLTTAPRARALLHLGLQGTILDPWHSGGDTVLLHLQPTPEIQAMSHSPSPRGPNPIRDIWRRRPGWIRVNLTPGPATTLSISETWDPGWRAHDEYGNKLDVTTGRDGFIRITVPPHTRQVRLSYRPQGWAAALTAGTAGICLLLFLTRATLRRSPLLSLILASRGAAAPLTFALAAFLLIGGLSAHYWSPTYDEGFHLTRGLTLISTGDSRLCYSHPPLQNILSAYFARLAFGNQLALPQSPAWHKGDAFGYAVDLAFANRDIWPDLIRAARTGSLVFGILLIIAAVRWAYEAAGPVAAWIAACGMALSPTILAHTHLATADAGFTALAVLGTWLLWKFHRRGNLFFLITATFFFAAAALVKFAGLIWFIAAIALSIPIFSLRRKKPALLLIIPLALLMFLTLTILLYGPHSQLVRIQHTPQQATMSLPAGRYLEGLLNQTTHALEGDRAFFAGHRFFTSPWWYQPAAAFLKTPLPWSLAALLVMFVYIRRPTRIIALLPILVPATLFTILLLFINHMAIGARHALPLIALATIATAVWAARIRRPLHRRATLAVLIAASLATATLSFPDYISYLNIAGGGTGGGHRCLADSNYDWGQDLDRLEQCWAALTDANDGHPPHLIYFGFTDPRIIYHLPTTAPSLCGYMHISTARTRLTPKKHTRWLESLSTPTHTTVASISAIRVQPYGINLDPLSRRRLLGRIGRCFFLYAPPQRSRSAAE